MAEMEAKLIAATARTNGERLCDYERCGTKGYSDGCCIEKGRTCVEGEMNNRAEGLHRLLTCHVFFLVAYAALCL